MDVTKQSHHEQEALCHSRACYRQGKKLTAVKVKCKQICQVYTVSDESNHLLVSNVPAIKLHTELCSLCRRFGDVTSFNLVPNYDDSQQTFVETYHIQYARIQAARFAKRQLDGRAFFGGVLHVCYAPELEDVNETRNKLIQRRREIAIRIKKRNCSNKDPELKLRSNLCGNNAVKEDFLHNKFKATSCFNVNVPKTIEIQQIEEASFQPEISHKVPITQSNNYALNTPSLSSSQPSQRYHDHTKSTNGDQSTHLFLDSRPNTKHKLIPRSVTLSKSKKIVFHKK